MSKFWYQQPVNEIFMRSSWTFWLCEEYCIYSFKRRNDHLTIIKIIEEEK